MYLRTYLFSVLLYFTNHYSTNAIAKVIVYIEICGTNNSHYWTMDDIVPRCKCILASSSQKHRMLN